MASPYQISPQIPSAPNPTPFSSSIYKLPGLKPSRPPIHNPYDKFTQPEFDAWIGGITGALKRALGQEDEEDPIEPDTRDPTTFVHSRSHVFDEDSELSDGHIDDSFAQVKARRAGGKGKARDPREGPGLGKGNSSNPIDLVSSDEDEEDAQEVELAIAGNNELEKDWDEDDDEEHSEEEYSWERGQPSSPPLKSSERFTMRREDSQEEVYSGDEYEEGYGEEGEQELDDDVDYGDMGFEPLPRPQDNDLLSDGEGETDEDDMSDRERFSSPRKVRDESLEGSEEEETRIRDSPPEVIEIDSADEVQTDEEEFLAHDTSSPPRMVRSGFSDERDDQGENHEEASKHFDYRGEEGEDYGEAGIAGGFQLVYSRDGPSIGRPHEVEHEYSEVVDDDEIQEIQPVEDDISFPPHGLVSPLESKRHVEIPDPWSGPRTYAEDYYSGGDAPILFGDNVDVNQLGPDDVDSARDLSPYKNVNDDIAQPVEENTAFPPHEEGPQASVDISDPWEGPQTFAEDYYSGGPVQRHGGPVTAHYLGPADGDQVGHLDHDAVDQAEEAKEYDEMQPLLENTSFPEENVDAEGAVEIPDPWIGPQTYAEDYYSGGDVRTLPGVPTDPALLSGTGDVEDDIDNFLTPGVLTPSQDEAHTRSTNEEEDEDEAGDTIIEMPNFPNTRRNAPIPEDAEVYAIDDSDEEQDPNLFQGEGNTMVDDDDDDISFGYPEFDESERPQQMEEVDQLDGDDVIVPPIVSFNKDGSDVAMSDHRFSDEGEDNFELGAPEDSNSSVVVGQVELEADALQQDDTVLPEAREEAEVPVTVKSFSIREETPPGLTHDTEEMLVIHPSEITEITSSSKPHVQEETTLEFVEESDSIAVPPGQGLPAENLVNDVDGKKDEELTEPVIIQPSSGNSTIEDTGIMDATLEADKETPNVGIQSYYSDEDDIRSSSSPQPQPSIAITLASNQSMIPEQLPTPPSEKNRFVSLPPDVQDSIDIQQSPDVKHASGEDEKTRPSSDKPQLQAPDASTLEYSVVEVTQSDMDLYMEEDTAERDQDTLDVRSAYTDEPIDGDSYIVEEPRTEGRLTVEPSERDFDLEVVSPDTKESIALAHGVDPEVAENKHESPTHAPLDSAALDPDEAQSLSKSEVTNLEPVAKMDAVSLTHPAMGRDEVPMPVTADPNVPDPTDQPSPSSNLPMDSSAEQFTHETQLDTDAEHESYDMPPPEAHTAPAQTDGLFTPAEPSVATTDEEIDSQRILTGIAEYVFGTTTSSPHGLDHNLSPPGQTPPLADVPPLGIDGHSLLPGDGASTTEDVFGQISSTSDVHGTDGQDNDKIDAPTLSYRVPSTSMRITLSRKATDPVLMADPYPYCLSTPGPSIYPRHDEASEEEIGLENPMSSKSAMAKDEDIHPGDGSTQIGPHYSQSMVISGGQPTLEAAGSQTIHNNPLPETGPRQNAHALETGTQTAILDNLLSPASSIDTLTGESSKRKRGKSSTNVSRTKKDNGEGQLATLPTGSSLESASKAISPRKQKKERKPTAKSSSSSRRKKATNYIPEMTSDETILVKPRQEGKVVESTQRATSLTLTQEGSPASSSATISRQLLQSDAATSVTSPVPSNISLTSQPSPTVNRPNVLPHPTAASESLLHAHGQKRKMMLAQALQKTFSPRSQSKKPHLTRFPTAPTISTTLPSTSSISPVVAPCSPSNMSPVGTTPPPAPSPTTSAKPNTPLNKANSVPSPASKFTTPVTRSHCRYHRISLPKEEGGPRVCFLVPGCSLNDKELMDEEEIVDHGDATVEDSRNMLKDVESLGFDLDLIGVLRQLVGLDILREQEVFYLPQPGEVIVRRNSLQKPATTIKETSSYAGSPGGYSGSAIPSPGTNRAPASASSWSESPSISSLLRQPPVMAEKDHTESDGGVTFADTDVYSESESSDDDEPNAKRAKSSPEDPGVMGPPNTTQVKGKLVLKSRANKKNDPTYEPDEDHDGDESDGTTSARKRRKSMRGIKRNRTSDVVSSGNDGKEREVKRLKSDLPASAESSVAPQTELPAQ